MSLEEIEDDTQQKPMELGMVGRLLSVRPYNFEALKRTLNQIWAISKGVLVRPIENGIFIVQFSMARDKSKVLDGRPWTFDNNLVLLDSIEGSVQPSNILLNKSLFRICMYNLPMDCRM